MYRRLEDFFFLARRWFLLVLSFSLYLGTLSSLVGPPAAAAPILVEEPSTADELTTETWFRDLPDMAEFREGATEPPLSTASGSLPRRVPRTNPTNVRAFHAEFDGVSEQGENATLKELLRSYVNTRQAISEVASQAIGSAPRSALFAERIVSSPSSVGGGAGEVLTSMIASIMQPVASHAGMMTFSILGLGEFALVGKNDGISLSIGDAFSFSVLGAHGEATLPGAFLSGEMGSNDMASVEPDLAADPEAPRITGSRVNYDSGPGEQAVNGGEVKQGQPNRPRISQMFTLVFDILTYPGTLLILLMVLLLPLIIEKNKSSRAAHFRGGRRQSMRRRSRRRRRSSAFVLPPYEPIKQEPLK